MNLRNTLSVAAAAALLTLASTAQAHEVTYVGNLLGSSEVPPVVTGGNGTAIVTVDLDLLTMRLQTEFSGLTGNVTAAHIHCCTNPGNNVGVASMTPSFLGFPLGGTSGLYDATFDMSLASSYSAAFITNNGGTVSTAFTALINGLDAGQAYLNVHTSFVPSGEIRALLTPQTVPEPATLALSLGALALAAGGLRLGKRAA